MRATDQLQRIPLPSVTVPGRAADAMYRDAHETFASIDMLAAARIVEATKTGLASRQAQNYCDIASPEADREKLLRDIERAESGCAFREVAADHRLAMKMLAEGFHILNSSGFRDVAEIAAALYPPTVRSVARGQAVSPVHHPPYVFRFACETTTKEARRDPSRVPLVRPVVIATLLHDMGIGDACLPKIGEAAVERASPADRPAFRQRAIDSRLEHMRIGCDQGALLLAKEHRIPDLERALILKIVNEHDNSKIPLLDREGCKRWLIPAHGFEAWALQLHWEADALWMLSMDGMAIDLRREGLPFTDVHMVERLSWNLHLHRTVVDFYRDGEAPDPFTEYGFPPEGHLYRSGAGQELAGRLIFRGLGALLPGLVARYPGVSKLVHGESAGDLSEKSDDEVRAILAVAGITGAFLGPSEQSAELLRGRKELRMALTAFDTHRRFPAAVEAPWKLPVSA